MVHVTDVLAVSMMLGITAQVKEAGIAWDKGEKKSKDLECCSGVLGQVAGPWLGGRGISMAVGHPLRPRQCPQRQGASGSCCSLSPWPLLCLGHMLTQIVVPLMAAFQAVALQPRVGGGRREMVFELAHCGPLQVLLKAWLQRTFKQWAGMKLL